MATAVDALVGTRDRGAAAFRQHHPADAIFFPAMVAVIWLLMLAGFVPEMVERSVGTTPPYPLIIHVHAVIYFGWLAFLAMQVTLVRTGRRAWHMRLGVIGVVLAVAVVLVGPAAGLTMQAHHQTRQPPQFLAIQFAAVLGFAVLVMAGMTLRQQPAAHKRLMLIATLALIGAGFGRVFRMVTGAPPPWTIIPAIFFAADALLIVIALYDLRTRRRLHPVFLRAAGGLVLTQLAAGYLLHSPAWAALTRSWVA